MTFEVGSRWFLAIWAFITAIGIGGIFLVFWVGLIIKIFQFGARVK